MLITIRGLTPRSIYIPHDLSFFSLTPQEQQIMYLLDGFNNFSAKMQERQKDCNLVEFIYTTKVLYISLDMYLNGSNSLVNILNNSTCAFLTGPQLINVI
ncbi:hypothetical protein H8356DRAFT_1340393 [Neocallimastix lanati (nom. inval.)]|nr:hypothetical protein H8356DRAFT_1340393 [Neocallimastix sp. JGI-2020a]